MELTTTEMHDVAVFLSRRITPDLELLDPTDPPRPGDPVRRWVERIEAAQRNGSLPVLADRIAARDPSDNNLQTACRLLAHENHAGSMGAGLLLVAGAMATLAAGLVAIVGLGLGGLLAMGSTPAPPEPEPDTLAVAVAVEHGEPPPLETTSEPHEPPPPRTEPVATGRCTDPEGGVVGYWYAGTTPPGQTGDEVVVPHMVNVRTDYPARANGFETGAHIRCVLRPGDVVRLSAEPIHVPRDSWWVPLVSGDLVQAGPTS